MCHKCVVSNAPPDPLAGFKGPTSKQRGMTGMGGAEREGARKGRGRGQTNRQRQRQK